MAENGAKVSIVVPTYNERENIPLLCDSIRNVLDGSWDYEVIIVDDNSPDGTSKTVRRLAEEDSRLRLLERPGKLGLGSAVFDGFQLASGNYWVMMDADLSHRPEDVPVLLSALVDSDIVVGSRHVAGGGVRNWPVLRRLVSRVASSLGRFLLDLKVRDLTSGFAAFRKEAIQPVLPTLNPKGFKILLEILAKARGATVKEVPITFVDRRYGKSKLTIKEVLMYLGLCIKLRGVRHQHMTKDESG